MVIYGIALLSACMFVGLFIGQLLGKAIGLNSDVGGVGFAMLILVLVSNYMDKKGYISPLAETGLKFWNNMYIPVVVAMAMQQNVVVAVSSGPVAILAGLGAVSAMYLLVIPIAKLADHSVDWDK